MHKLFKHTVFIGKKAFFLPSCHSTNEMASVLLSKQEQYNGTVIHTDFQTAGKGQRGNSWESNEGENILLSVILDTQFLDPTDIFDLTIVTSLAIHDLLTEYYKEDFRIKWPNDIFFQDKKIAGILIENYIRQNIIEWCIVGVGLNVNQRRFQEPKAISLASICDQDFDREELTNILLLKLEKRYFDLKNGERSKLRKAYIKNLYWRDELHVFLSEGSYFNGKISNVASSGKLIIEVEEGTRKFDFKEVQFIK